MRTIRALAVSVRPRQWTKNLIVFAPLIFAARLAQPDMLLRAAIAFVLFCLISGAVYLMNDVRDAESDRRHERKKLRPIAAGELDPKVALAAAFVLLAVALAGSVALSPLFAVVASSYLVLQIAYTLFLKHQVILDVMCISAGFVLRAVAGTVAIAVPASSWLLACAALLALFLGLGKRRSELLLADAGGPLHRPVLDHYSTQLIDQMVSAVTAATIVTYALYTSVSSSSQSHHYLMLTVPFVVYGLFRYLYLVHHRQLGGNPEDILLTDLPLVIAIGLWAASAIAAVNL